MSDFVRLHLPTDYSLLDDACNIEKLVRHVAKIGQKGCCHDDHGNIYGAV